MVLRIQSRWHAGIASSPARRPAGSNPDLSLRDGGRLCFAAPGAAASTPPASSSSAGPSGARSAGAPATASIAATARSSRRGAAALPTSHARDDRLGHTASAPPRRRAPRTARCVGPRCMPHGVRVVRRVHQVGGRDVRRGPEPLPALRRRCPPGPGPAVVPSLRHVTRHGTAARGPEDARAAPGSTVRAGSGASAPGSG